MSEIKIKTGDGENDSSNCRAQMEICDDQGQCCQTSSEGRGLHNPGKNRERGKIDVYSNKAVLGNCAQEVIFCAYSRY